MIDPSPIFHLLTLGRFEKDPDSKGLHFGFGLFLYILAGAGLLGFIVVRIMR